MSTVNYDYRVEAKMHVLVAPVGEEDGWKKTLEIPDEEFDPRPIRRIESLEKGRLYFLVGEITPFANESPVVVLFNGMIKETTSPTMDFTAFADNKEGETELFSWSRNVWVGDRDNMGIFPSKKSFASDHWTHALIPMPTEVTSPEEAIARAKEIAKEKRIQLH